MSVVFVFKEVVLDDRFTHFASVRLMLTDILGSKMTSLDWFFLIV